MENQKALENLCTQVRRDILRMVHGVSSGHPGGSLGCTEFLVTLYGEIMDYSTDFKMEGKNEDVFILSNGHISPVFYSVLARNGFFPVSELATFRKLNSRLQGHPTTHEGLPGIRIATGSLGQGTSVAIGIAQAKKLDGDQHLVYTLQGDGELQEGQIWEALMYAGAKKVDNLIMTIDRNGRQIDGDTKDVLNLGDLETKLKAFLWDVVHVKKGNDLEAIYEGINTAKAKTGKGKPVAILLDTEMGHGVDYMMGTHAWHGKAPNDDELEKALQQNILEELSDY
ncbi:Transketolase 2 [Candidatus Ornithobacterium hominis]|uniref:Transketolase 2 n=1 Tax=Candidatus Ornithobacterium hominis TaxID=2497989 RepID=A0A383TYK2_9FLAO|nr:transketolase [Candidatus Ornithobacterium hominis]MCT7904152.1 transketolase [Candidatus Ornithobacterium hominis]SZD72308.1 Transketolase 2 [Candidatus Ornithobacterium hominis]